MFLEVVDLMHMKKTSEDFHLVKIKNVRCEIYHWEVDDGSYKLEIVIELGEGV